MYNDLKQNSFRNYMQLFADDMQFMAYQSWNWDNLETGGALFGLWSHAGRPVILLATPQGPGACNQAAHFAQNPEHLFQVSQELQRKYGLQYIGNWHSHHSLGLDHPSGGDVQQIHRVAIKSNVQRMVQIVITRTGQKYPLFQKSGFCQKISTGLINSMKACCPANDVIEPCSESRQKAEVMRVNAFIYEDAQKGTYQRCPVAVLSELNPIRHALAGSALAPGGSLQLSKSLPLEAIVYDKVERSVQSQPAPDVIPPFILRQIESLPSSVSGKSEVHVDQGVLFMSVPLGNGTLIVAYKKQSTEYQICSVGVVSDVDKQLTDYSDKVQGHEGFLSVGRIYERLENLLQAGKSTSLIEQYGTVSPVLDTDKDIVRPRLASKTKLAKYTENNRSVQSCGQEHNNNA